MKKLYFAKNKLFLSAAAMLLFGFSARAQFPAPYCSVEFPDGAEPITSVTFAGITNTSSAALNGPSMQDFTAITGTVQKTLSYPITLKGNTGGNWTNYFRVYIDWNQDNDFDDAGESYDIGTIVNSTGTDTKQVSGNISVPFGATTGTTRMRVTKRFSSYSSPCNATGFGETEDYSLTVLAAPSCLSPLAVQLGTVTKNSVMLNWTAAPTVPSAGYQVYYSTTNTAPDGTTTPNGGSSTTTMATVGGLMPSTTYYTWVRSNCDGDGFSPWVAGPTFATLCNYPDITATIPGAVCGQGTVQLDATATGGQLFWYDAATGGNYLGTGSPFTTPVVTATTNFYVTAGTVTPASTVVLGAGSQTSASAGNSPYYHGWGGVKSQYIIRASEMHSAGIAPGPINSISFTIVTLGIDTFNDFAVSIGSTTQNVATTSHISGLTTVYTNPAQTLTTGLNTYTFNAPFNWDGMSNIVVQTCYSNVNFGDLSSSVLYDNPGFVSGTYTYADNQSAADICAAVTGAVNGSGGTGTISARPKINFNANAVCSGPRQMVEATASTAVAITASASDNSLCLGESTDLSVTSANADYAYVWMPGNLSGATQTVSPTQTTTYTVTATDAGTSCVQTQTVVITVSNPPASVVIEGDADICSGEMVQLNIAGYAEPIPYCIPTVVGFPEDTGDYLKNFSFANITNNDTDDAISDYTYYDSMTANVVADGSTTYPISFMAGGTTGLYAQQFAAWIDFNQNGTFEATEMVFTSTTSTFSPNVTSGTVTIPANALTGVTRMRIAAKYGDPITADLACQVGTEDAGAFGEFEDYNVNITGGIEYVWSPQTGLYTDAAGTMAYAGESTGIVYAMPSADQTYTLTATIGAGCSSADTIDMTVTTTPAPTGDDTQVFTMVSTIDDLEATGTDIQWYADATGGNPLDSSDDLVDGGTYYATQTVNGCESATRFEVTVTIDLPEMDWVNLQWPPTLAIDEGTTGDVYAQGYEAGVTEGAGPGTGVTAWIGVSTTNTDPETWTTWIPATFNVQAGNNDEFTAAIGTGLTPGTYYYASRFQLNGGEYSYGGYNAGGGGFWNGTDNVNGVLTVNCNVTAPTLNANQTFCDAGVIDDIDVTATGNIVWYADATGGTPLPTNTPLVDGENYFAAFTEGSCESDRVEVTVDIVTVSVTAPDDVTACNSYTLPALPNGMYYSETGGTGDMMMAGDEITTSQTIYVFDMQGQCSDEDSFTVTINTVAPPTGDATQIITVTMMGEATIDDIITNETGVSWYDEEADAIGGTGELGADTQLIDGNTYYGTLTDGNCTSVPFAVTVQVVLGTESFDFANLTYYPNPVKDVLTIKHTSDITAVTVHNMLGQQVLYKEVNATEAGIDMAVLADGTYIVNVTAGSAVKTIRVVKKQ